MFCGSMIGAGIHGNGRHWYNVSTEDRVIAMKVRIALISLMNVTDFLFSTGGSAKLDSVSHRFSARFPFASS